MEKSQFGAGSRNLDQNQLLRLADCRWVQHHEDLIITGKCGSGKSLLASALGHPACRRGSPPRWAIRRACARVAMRPVRGTPLGEG